MNRQQLLESLAHNFSAPQPSERWAMYRLITPVIDHANHSLGLLPYFEYNQTSQHGTHQSVDIALLDAEDRPVVLVEAKRADRKLSPQQIEKYLNPTVRGVVTNGFVWILCSQNTHEAISLYTDRVEGASLDKILGFLEGAELLNAKANTIDDVYLPALKPRKIVNKTKISRPTHPKQVTSSAAEFSSFVESAANRPENESALLDALCHSLGESPLPKHVQIETRDTRVSIFDSRLSRVDKRLARIELGKAQPDVLVRTWIVEEHPELAQIAKPTVHDKGIHMRRFRLGSKEEAKRFGQTMISTIRKAVK